MFRILTLFQGNCSVKSFTALIVVEKVHTKWTFQASIVRKTSSGAWWWLSLHFLIRSASLKHISCLLAWGENPHFQPLALMILFLLKKIILKTKPLISENNSNSNLVKIGVHLQKLSRFTQFHNLELILNVPYNDCFVCLWSWRWSRSWIPRKTCGVITQSVWCLWG